MIVAILISLIPWAFWWRFGNAPLDRDWTPYCYPAIFGTGWLEDGHFDIKPPVIHWSFKLWVKCVSWLKLPMTSSQNLRLLPTITLSASCCLVTMSSRPTVGLSLALLTCSPYLWTHMANTEWLTVSVLSAMIAIPSLTSSHIGLILVFFLAGLLPWINQKNLLLLVPVIWAMGLTQSFISNPVLYSLAVTCSSIIIMLYFLITNRVKKIWQACVLIPQQMAKTRTFKANNMLLIRNAVIEIVPFICCLNWNSRWSYIFLIFVCLMVASKQIVPHHFLILAIPLSLACQPTAGLWLSVSMLLLLRHLKLWINPALLYPITFNDPRSGTDYGRYLADSVLIEAWLKENTSDSTVIWVNGCENQIYLNAHRKAEQINVPEYNEKPENNPEYVIHCAAGYIIGPQDPFWKQYEPVVTSHLGLYTLLRRKNRVATA